MDQFKKSFVHHPEYKIIVCREKQCSHAVIPAHFPAHLAGSHAFLSVKTRREMVEAMNKIEGLAKNEDEVVYPEPTSPAVPHLPKFTDGKKCLVCGRIYRVLRGIQEHCRDKHGWENSRKRGRQPRIQVVHTMWKDAVHCQQFFKAGGMRRLFEVEEGQARSQRMEEGGEGSENGEQETGFISQQVRAAFESAGEKLEQVEKESAAVIEEDNNRWVVQSWLKRTGWAKHLAPFNREMLVKMMQNPGRREKRLAKLCVAMEVVIWKAQRASRPEVVGWAAVNYINRREVGNDTNEKPIDASQKAKTMVDYSKVFTRVLSYIWRTQDLEAVNVSDLRAESENTVERKRPAYRFTDKQAGALERIREAVGGGNEEDIGEDDAGDSSSEEDSGEDSEGEEESEEDCRLQDRVLEFVLALLDHDIRDHEYSSAFVSAMAVLGVDVERGWKKPFIYTPTLSAVVTVARMLVLFQAKRSREERIARLIEDDGWVKEEAELMAPAHFDLVKEMSERFMTLTKFGGRPSPMDWMLRLRTYGMKIRFNTAADGVVDWQGDRLLYGHISFTMAELRGMIHGLVTTIRENMWKDLLLLDIGEDGVVKKGTTQPPPIPWDRIVDNPAEMKTGWNFFKDPRNTFGGVDGQKWLAERVWSESRLRKAFVDVVATRGALATGGEVVWKEKRIKEYERAMKLSDEQTLVAVHMTGGLPARGTELVTIQHINGSNGEGRGMFIEDGMMVTVSKYHKGYQSSQKAKVIHRYLPREVGELLFYYLWIIRPFWRKLERASGRRKEKADSSFLWQPKQEEEWQCPRKTKRRRIEREGNGVEDEGAVLSKDKGVDEWDTNRIRRAIQRASTEWMGVKIHIMCWRHASKAIYRRYIDDKAVVKTVEDEDEDGDGEDEAFDMQSGHGTKIGGMIYGRSIEESPFHTMSQRAAFRKVSKAWHQFLMFPSAVEEQGTTGKRAVRARKEALEEEFRRWRRLRLVDVQERLEALVCKGAQFRSVQQPAMRAIMQQKSPIVVVMGTGAGKSMLFMLPASCSTGVTIVVVPLVSLREDLTRRCVEAGIECVQWSSRHPDEWASIVLVTPELAVSESFGNFINRQRAMGRLDRIVIDECHVVLDSTEGWRTRMLALRDLVKTETQLVYLTATMRPSEEGQFIKLMGLPGKEISHWFRGVTTKKNVEYKVVLHDRREEEETVVKLVQEKKNEYPMPGQIIVYCDTVGKAKRLAEVLGCVCFHRNVGTANEKSEILKQLTEGRQQVFTATNALGLGVDAPTIRVVIHVGMVRKLRDYMQESGRAGRDGLKSEAIILRGITYNENGEIKEDYSESRWVEPSMMEFMATEGCMRVVADREMDGRMDRVGCEDGEGRCDRCSKAGVEQESSESGMGEIGSEELEEEEFVFEQEQIRRRMVAHKEVRLQGSQAVGLQELEDKLEEWRVGCVMCRAFGELADGHVLDECSRQGAEGLKYWVSQVRETIRWQRFAGCWYCGLPQAICERWESNDGLWRRVAGGKCQFTGVLIESVMAVWYARSELLESYIYSEMGLEAGEREEFDVVLRRVVLWFGQKVRVCGVEGSNICEVFRRFG